jgi:hypothetical protein
LTVMHSIKFSPESNSSNGITLINWMAHTTIAKWFLSSKISKVYLKAFLEVVAAIGTIKLNSVKQTR